jgi:nucleoside 2-deoxyribosyltransferase
MSPPSPKRRKFRIYLAGPDVFLPNAIQLGQRKKQLCAQYGFEGLYPFDNEIVHPPPGTRVDTLIYRANVKMIRRADCGIFNLTPFRGPSADVGTVFELGMMIGLGKPAFAYTNDTRELLDRVRNAWSIELDQGFWRDTNRMSIENFGNSDNLMIDAALRDQGHPIIRRHAVPDRYFDDLVAFEECLQLASRELSFSREPEAHRSVTAL